MSDDTLPLHVYIDRIGADVDALKEKLEAALAKARALHHRVSKPNDPKSGPRRPSPPWRNGIPPWVNLNVITNADPFSGTGKSPATGPQPTDDGS